MTFSTPRKIKAEFGGRTGEWRNARHICALADEERHLGHVVMTDQWHAYDAVHPNETATGFTYLGAFVSRSEAKDAVEAAVTAGERRMAMGTASGSREWPS
jgi:hypothetical protein